MRDWPHLKYLFASKQISILPLTKHILCYQQPTVEILQTYLSENIFFFISQILKSRPKEIILTGSYTSMWKVIKFEKNRVFYLQGQAEVSIEPHSHHIILYSQILTA